MLGEFPHAIAMQHPNQPDDALLQSDVQCILTMVNVLCVVSVNSTVSIFGCVFLNTWPQTCRSMRLPQCQTSLTCLSWSAYPRGSRASTALTMSLAFTMTDPSTRDPRTGRMSSEYVCVSFMSKLLLCISK